jgi:apolipoprotein N-acyltransferase
MSGGAGFFLSVLSAGLLWLGFPGGGELWPVLFVALVPLLYVAQCNDPKRSFFFGLLTGFCHFTLLLYWIVIVLGRYGGLPLFFSIPALVLLSLYMSLYLACFAMFSSAVLKRQSAFVAMWIIPAIWVGLDWLRAILFSGFPWMDPGYALWQHPFLIQISDLFGHYSITFMLLLANALFLLTWNKRQSKWSRLQMVFSVVFLFVFAGTYSHYRWQHIEKSIADSDSATIGIVQGNIDQSRKWTPEAQQGTIDTYINNSRSLLQNSDPPELIVWPETALPFFPATNPLIGNLQFLAMESDVTLLTGSPWFEVINRAKKEINYYNSAFLLLPNGEYGGMYFKSHLVPYGEYVPMKKMLPFLAPLVEAVGDFTPGNVEKPLVTGRIKGGILICFESIFPDIARRWVNAGANVLINLTNDAWYGKSSAPSHSMAMSVFRSVETRRSLVRAANTGISAFVDPLGRVQGSSEIFTIWAKSMEVSLMEEDTFNTRYGHFFAPLCLLISLFVVLAGKVGRPKKQRIS